MVTRMLPVLAIFAILGHLRAQGSVNVDSATSQEEPGAIVQFDNTKAGSAIRFVVRRGGLIIGTSVIVEWPVVNNQVVTVLFSNSDGPVQPAAGDKVQAEVVGEEPSNEVVVQ